MLVLGVIQTWSISYFLHISAPWRNKRVFLHAAVSLYEHKIQFQILNFDFLWEWHPLAWRMSEWSESRQLLERVTCGTCPTLPWSRVTRASHVSVRLHVMSCFSSPAAHHHPEVGMSLVVRPSQSTETCLHKYQHQGPQAKNSQQNTFSSTQKWFSPKLSA